MKDTAAENGKGSAPAEASAETYRFLIEATNPGFVVLDGRGIVLETNREYVRMTGRDSLEYHKNFLPRPAQSPSAGQTQLTVFHP